MLLVGQCAAQAYTDADIYNFALNLEYLEVRLGPGVRRFAWFADQHRAIALRQLVALWLISTVHTLWLVLGHQAGNSRKGVRYSCPQLVFAGLSVVLPFNCRPTSTTVVPMELPLQTTSVAQTQLVAQWVLTQMLFTTCLWS